MLGPDGWRRNGVLRTQTPKIVETIEGRCLDAALLLGLAEQASGAWSLAALDVAQARTRATGKGVTVAILDHMFVADDPALDGRVVAPGCVVDGEPVYSIVRHGTWMARILLKVAPDVRVMPVRILAGAAYRTSDLTDYYVKGIDYAVRNGAQVVSISQQPIPKARQADLDAAIERAAEAGVTVVYIHYRGTRRDVVASGMIEFAPFNKDRVFVVGTGFVDEDTCPYTWGVSQTAPLVAGVVALMTEAAPSLAPSGVVAILRQAGPVLPSGFRLLDAGEAVARAVAAKSSR